MEETIWKNKTEELGWTLIASTIKRNIGVALNAALNTQELIYLVI
jgi:hypothetical protein